MQREEKDDRFEMPWRDTYESYAVAGWGASLMGTLASAAVTAAPMSLTAVAASISAIGLAARAMQAKKHYDFRLSLAGTEFLMLPLDTVLGKIEPDHLWFGLGWEWRPIHTQRYYEATKINIKSMLPPAWYARMKGTNYEALKKVKGKPWIHGLNPRESDIQVQLGAVEGHSGIYGTTGSGKTRLLETLTTQIIMNPDDVLIILDPKGDKELKEIAKEACARANRLDKFIVFHPAFPTESVRFDPLKVWSRKTQIASRIAACVSNGQSDSFVSFAWRSINTVSAGLLYVGARPNLKSIRKYVSAGPDELTMLALESFFNAHALNWESFVLSLIEKASQQKNKNTYGLNKDASPKLIAYVDYYTNNIADEIKQAPEHEAVKDLINLSCHSREHYGKVIVNILPLLDMLCTDELGVMLSPDANDINDSRPIFDSTKVIDGKYILYVGLDSLSDATVGSALASILLADLAAKAGEIYNYSEGKGKGRIHLIVDEAAEAVCQPLIQILNKGRGAGIVAWLLTQTFPDFVVKMGSADAARQILGNLNNVISLRVIDAPTQEFISEQFGETAITITSTSYSSGSKSDDAGMAQQGTISQGSNETTVPLISKDLINYLPDLHYIAKFGGKIYKGRLAKLI